MRILPVAIFCLTVTLAVAAEPKFTSDDLLARATAELVAGRFDLALAVVADLEKAGQNDAALLALRGSIYLEQGKYDEAMADFRAAHEKDAAPYAPRFHLGDALLRQKKWEEARTTYEDLLKQTNILVLSERLRYAILMTWLGAKNDAEAKTVLARLTFPTESPAYYYAQAAWSFAHGDTKGGRKWMETAGKIYSEPQTAWFARPLYDLGWIKTKPPIVLD